MLRSHLGFGLFLLLLLVAPKLPVALSGGAARSAVSLGFVGFIGWYLLCPERLFRYPVITVRHAFFWVLAFALYAVIISLLSTKTVSIAYSIQFLFYSVCGIALMGCRALRPAPLDSNRSRWILFAVGVTYCLGVLVSVYVGPIYGHQTLATRRHWGGFIIPQGIGFAESQNIAGAVIIVFLMASIYLYRGRLWKKWFLLSLFLSALLATLSRSAITSFLIALFSVWVIAGIEPLARRASVRISVLTTMGFTILTFCVLVFGIIGVIALVNRSLVPTLFHGFGLGGNVSLIADDAGSRLDLWIWGVRRWWAGSTLEVLFGGGFRSSMVVMPHGAWKTAHNMYITVLSDFGVVGVILFLAIPLSAIGHYTSLFLLGKAGQAESFSLATVIALSLHSTTGPYLYSPICLSLLLLALAQNPCHSGSAGPSWLPGKSRSCKLASSTL